MWDLKIFLANLLEIRSSEWPIFIETRCDYFSIDLATPTSTVSFPHSLLTPRTTFGTVARKTSTLTVTLH